MLLCTSKSLFGQHYYCVFSRQEIDRNPCQFFLYRPCPGAHGDCRTGVCGGNSPTAGCGRAVYRGLSGSPQTGRFRHGVDRRVVACPGKTVPNPPAAVNGVWPCAPGRGSASFLSLSSGPARRRCSGRWSVPARPPSPSWLRSCCTIQALPLMPVVMTGLLDTAGNVLFALAAQIGRLDIAASTRQATVILARTVLKEPLHPHYVIGLGAAMAAVVMISFLANTRTAPDAQQRWRMNAPVKSKRSIPTGRQAEPCPGWAPATMPERTPSTDPMDGQRSPQRVPESSTCMTKPKAVANPPSMTRTAVEVSPTHRAAMVMMVAKRRLTQICSALLHSCLRT